MRVDLRRGQAGVAEHLLDRPEIGAALEQMSGRAVPQTVRPNVRCVRNVLQQPVDRAPDLAWVDPAASSAQEQCRTTARPDHLPPAQPEPSLQRSDRRPTERAVSYTHLRAHETDSYLV